MRDLGGEGVAVGMDAGVPQLRSGHPLGRPAEDYELAPAYLFPASEEAGYITGRTIHVDGSTPVGG